MLFVAACGASPASSPASTRASSPKAASTAAVNACLVGKWTTTPLSGTTVQDGDTLTYGGGAGETFTIRADGEVTVDTSNAQPITMTAPTHVFTLSYTKTFADQNLMVDAATIRLTASS